MNDDFEQHLQRQPLRQVPAGWRGEILAAANSQACQNEAKAVQSSFLSTLNHQLSTIFWPHPKAWAGLAAVWILIFAVDISIRDTSPKVAEKSAPPSPEMIVELKKQQLMFAELVGAHEPSEAARQKIFSPKPRSERVEIFTA